MRVVARGLRTVAFLRPASLSEASLFSLAEQLFCTSHPHQILTYVKLLRLSEAGKRPAHASLSALAMMHQLSLKVSTDVWQDEVRSVDVCRCGV
jgi:hypothetical protein